MATRFWLSNDGTPNLLPAYDAGWEQTGQANWGTLSRKSQALLKNALTNSIAMTVPITTTQDILCLSLVSGPIPPQRITGTVSLVIRCFESVTTVNVTLAVVVKVVDAAGNVRGTLFSTFSTDSAFPLSASAATRIVNAQALTALTTLPGDRLVVEIGGHAAAPSTSGTYQFRFGNSAATDFALTSALTTDLNPWVEFSDLSVLALNNYQAIDAGDGMSVTEKIR